MDTPDPQHPYTNYLMALDNLHAMGTTEGAERLQHALNVMTAVVMDFQGYDPYTLIIALVSHLTFSQPNPQESLQFILESVVAAWKSVGGVDSKEITEAMAEKNATGVVH